MTKVADSLALVVGVGAGEGLGAALCRRFAREGLHTVVAGRTAEKIGAVVDEIAKADGSAEPVPLDTTVEAEVTGLFGRLKQDGRPLDLVVYNAGNNRWGDIIDMEADFFEDVWRVCCLGGFLVGREAARAMVPREKGTIIFTGATASIRGRPPFAAFASAKAALRIFAQAMARDFGPKGIHVGHVIIDGGIDGDMINARFPDYKKNKGADGMLNIDAIADAFWAIHTQHRSAWTHELDLRPWSETF